MEYNESLKERYEHLREISRIAKYVASCRSTCCSYCCCYRRRKRGFAVRSLKLVLLLHGLLLDQSTDTDTSPRPSRKLHTPNVRPVRVTRRRWRTAARMRKKVPCPIRTFEKRSLSRNWSSNGLGRVQYSMVWCGWQPVVSSSRDAILCCWWVVEPLVEVVVRDW